MTPIARLVVASFAFGFAVTDWLLARLNDRLERGQEDLRNTLDDLLLKEPTPLEER